MKLDICSNLGICPLRRVAVFEIDYRGLMQERVSSAVCIHSIVTIIGNAMYVHFSHFEFNMVHLQETYPEGLWQLKLFVDDILCEAGTGDKNTLNILTVTWFKRFNSWYRVTPKLRTVAGKEISGNNVAN